LSTSSKNKVPVILLFGPTAAGKTGLLADLFTDHFEVINADSEQVYRGLDIGTAKPDAVLRARIPHHLIDVRDPDEIFSVGDFVRAADQLVVEIAGRGRVPVVSGGTAYYFKHFAFGLPAAPPSDPAVRAAVKAELETKGGEAMYAELERLDPASARKINPRDHYRICRALEVIRQAGRPLSDYTVAAAARSEYDFLFIGLRLPREELEPRVRQRVEAMLAAGLVEEVRRLVGYGPAAPAMKGIGYRDILDMLTNGSTVAEAGELIVRHTLQYAKRQMTFFRSFAETRWFHPSERTALCAACDGFLKERPAPERG
jgi:tRNA dimethylallyltransferase